ncbi:antitoxin [Brachybacterium sp. FME24]|uniref:antitoxin n=1 Tax=Brachybacterium sp. FME24 TaxID=2742605 RepID=UPI0018663FB6|nr:antitoxin [Brachybacterium sp. FME24]
MGFDDALNKAKGFASENSEQAEQGIDAATEQIKERTPDNIDEHVDSGADAARDQLGLGGDENKGGEQGN